MSYQRTGFDMRKSFDKKLCHQGNQVGMFSSEEFHQLASQVSMNICAKMFVYERYLWGNIFVCKVSFGKYLCKKNMIVKIWVSFPLRSFADACVCKICVHKCFFCKLYNLFASK